jgi:hypothetical protein
MEVEKRIKLRASPLLPCKCGEDFSAYSKPQAFADGLVAQFQSMHDLSDSEGIDG